MSPFKTILLVTASFAAIQSFSQPVRIHASGIYVSDELVYVAPDPQNAGALNRIRGGFKQGLGLEYRRPGKSHSFEMLYFGQKTRIEDWHYKEGSIFQKTDLRASFNHLLLSPIQ
ncbi:MAG: hypothetical protein EBZ67_14195, partial [Chitinophagia bacterium]|nr:hypothetical protein [Chitinophagia bacterium]